MTEFVVRWKHWRYPAAVDRWLALEKAGRVTMGQTERAIAKRTLRTAREWQQDCTHLAQHGGSTLCVIWEQTDVGGPGSLVTVATGEAICSWRDQFDRRVGRLYSLALALCEMPDLTPDDLDLWDAFGIQTRDYCKPYQFDQLCGYIMLKDKPVVKSICAEIVKSWHERKPRCRQTSTSA